MKVALISEWLDAWRGGAETSTGQFINHLIDAGVRLEVFTRSRLPARPGMEVHVVPVAGLGRAVRSLTFRRSADRMARASGCDLVHAITPSMAADVYQPRGGTYPETIRRNLAASSGRPERAVRRFARFLNVKQRLLLGCERRMLARRRQPVVIAISDYVVRQLREHYGLADDRIHKVYNGVEPDDTDNAMRARNRSEVRKLYEIGEDDFLVLMVAHNFKLKGLVTWIDAVSIVHRESTPAVQSLVVGKGPVVRWQRLAGRRGLGRALQFPGPTQRVRAFYHAADVLVHPTFYDPCSRVVLEAMVSGLPCVTTRFDGASEVIEDGVNGFVLDAPDDAAGLADRVLRLADPDFRRRMGDNAKRIAGCVAMSRHAHEVVAVYEKLLNRTATARQRTHLPSRDRKGANAFTEPRP